MLGSLVTALLCKCELYIQTNNIFCCPRCNYEQVIMPVVKSPPHPSTKIMTVLVPEHLSQGVTYITACLLQRSSGKTNA